MTSNTNPTDVRQLAIWLRAASKEDALAFRSLYDACAPKLYGLALRILRRRELAEEVLQESFVAIWRNASEYESSLAAPMTWMSTIVRNRSFDLLRRTQNHAETQFNELSDFDEIMMASLQDPQGNPADALQLSSEAKALAACMSALEEKHRRVVGLAFFHDLSHSDVAQQLALPIGTVKTWIRRSLVRLQSCLTGRGLT